MVLTKKLQKDIVKKGYALLKKHRNYSQAEVVSKMCYLGNKSSNGALSKILKDSEYGDNSLWNNAKGMRELVYKELGYEFKDGSYIKTTDKNWEPFIVPGKKGKNPIETGFYFNEYGRMTIQDKVNFFSSARKNMYEFGLTLNTFSSYFFHRNPMEFKQPIIELLRKGVIIKCFLLEPDRNETRLYFEDRAKVSGFQKEINASEKIKEVLQRLGEVHREFEKAHYAGAFEVYTYRHIPTGYFLVIDPEQDGAKMNVSHYLYGQRRANNPVLAFTKHDHPHLFKTYWESLQWMMKDARRVVF